MGKTVDVLYKCACMNSEAMVHVRYRRSDEDVIDWVEGVMLVEIGRDHAQRSPLCMRTKTEYVKIPAPENAPFIGGKPELH